MYRNVRDPWRIVFQKYVVEIGRDRHEQQPKAIYAKVLMQRFRPDLVSSGILTFPSLATCSHQIHQPIKSLMDSAFKITPKLAHLFPWLPLQDVFISPLPSCNTQYSCIFHLVLSCIFTLCLHRDVRVITAMIYNLKSDHETPSLKPFSSF